MYLFACDSLKLYLLSYYFILKKKVLVWMRNFMVVLSIAHLKALAHSYIEVGPPESFDQRSDSNMTI